MPANSPTAIESELSRPVSPYSGDTSTSHQLFTRAQSVLPSGYTRSIAVTSPYPLYAAAGDGCYVTDVDGNRRLDWVNNFSALIHGHGKKEVAEATTSQTASLTCAAMPTESEIRLAELLVARMPCADKVRFMNSGTEAVMTAVKVARAHTGKPKMAKVEGGYHGQFDLLETSFSSTPENWGELSEPNRVPYSEGTPASLMNECIVLPHNDVDAARRLLRKYSDELAGAIIDPMRLQLGMLEPSRDFLEMLREETHRLGIVLIFDEIFCYRVSYDGAQGSLGITPDLTTIGKIIGGGLPIGALVGTSAMMGEMNVSPSGDARVKHSGTFTANPLSMVAGYAAMSLMTQEAFDRLDVLSEQLRLGLRKTCKDHRLPVQVFGNGSLSYLFLTDRKIGTYRDLVHEMRNGMAHRILRFQRELMNEGIINLRGSFNGSTPMTGDDIDFTVAAVERVLRRIFQ